MFDTERVHIIVHGRVQGVFFRDSTRRKAGELSLTGMVRNLMDGTVEIVAEGPKDILEQFVLWSDQGPPSAQVERTEVTWEEPLNEFTSFSIHYSL